MKYDLLHFYRDNIIANSGVKGDWVNIPYLPEWLGPTVPERLAKFIAYKKSGIAPLDMTMEGLDDSKINTIFSGFDDSLKQDTVQAIELAIERIENTASLITGVFRERLGGIEQRDAVTNVEVGVRQSAIITKQYYQLMDLVFKEILIDYLNEAKVVYKKGMTGVVILDNKLQKIFTALPEHFTVTDFDIHVADSSEILRDMETIKAITMEMIKAGAVEMDIIIDSVTSESLTELKDLVKSAYDKRRKENNQLQQLGQQNQELQNSLKELNSQLQQATEKLNKYNDKDLEIKEYSAHNKAEKDWAEQRDNQEYLNKKLELDKKRVDLEALQLFDDDHRNDKVRNS